jgi:arylsulfatase A-like enzyme
MRQFIIVLALLTLFQSVSATATNFSLDGRATADLSCPDCNVVLLDIDLLRSDFVGLLTSGVSDTPQIDEFFKKSIIFRDVSSSSGVTAISNTATLTGRYGEFTYGLLRRTYKDKPPQMPHKYRQLYLKIPTIAETLHRRGYETLNVNHGWYAGKQMLLDRGIDFYWGSGEVGAVDSIPGSVIGKTAEWLQERANNRKPFFLLMRSEDLRGLPYRYPINRPHIKDPRIEYRRHSASYFDIYFQPQKDGTLSVKFPSTAKVNWMSDIQIEEYRRLTYKLYRQQLRYVDEELRRIFDVLRNTNLRNNTIVILYSNHGDGLYDNRVPNHGVSYQSCVSVPLLIRHPNVREKIQIQDSIALIDLGPTIYEMLSVASLAKVDGISVVNLVTGAGAYPDRHFYGTDKESKYIRSGRFKLIVWADRSKELFDISKDPRERNNLARLRPDLVRVLYQNLVLHEAEQLGHVLTLLKSFNFSTNRIE